MTITEIHARLANTGLYFILIMALWGLWRYLRKQGVDSSYFGALVIGEILILAQGALGAYMWFSGLRPERSLHLIYGISSALVVPAIFAWTRGGDKRREMLIYGIGLLFMTGLLLRAITTGGG
jgi:heme A synthase